jgi:pimeloyl-ACP methyl ester carboxylesterase
MGGAISGVYAASHPERLLSLAFIATAGVKPPEEPEYFELLARGENPLVVNSVEDFDRMMEFIFVKAPPVPDFARRAAAARAAANSSFGRKVFKEMVAENKGFVLDPLLAKISTRSLILWGDTDRVLDPSSVTVLEQGLTKDRTVIMKECGHVPYMERPREAADHYLAFLRRGS